MRAIRDRLGPAVMVLMIFSATVCQDHHEQSSLAAQKTAAGVFNLSWGLPARGMSVASRGTAFVLLPVTSNAAVRPCKSPDSFSMFQAYLARRKGIHRGCRHLSEI